MTYVQTLVVGKYNSLEFNKWLFFPEISVCYLNYE